MCEPVLITLSDASPNVITVIMSPWQVYANSLTTSGYCDPLVLPGERSAPGKGLFGQCWFPSVPWPNSLTTSTSGYCDPLVLPGERSAPGKGLFGQGWFPSVPWSPAYLVHTPAPHWTEAGCQSTEHVLTDTEAVPGPECRLCVVLWDLHNAQRCPDLTHCYLHYGGTRLRHDNNYVWLMQ